MHIHSVFVRFVRRSKGTPQHEKRNKTKKQFKSKKKRRREQNRLPSLNALRYEWRTKLTSKLEEELGSCKDRKEVHLQLHFNIYLLKLLFLCISSFTAVFPSCLGSFPFIKAICERKGERINAGQIDNGDCMKKSLIPACLSLQRSCPRYLAKRQEIS